MNQQISEVMIRVIDAGPDGNAVGEPDASDPPVARTVWVRAEAAWAIDQLITLLPTDMPCTARINETTCAVASSEFLGLTPDEAYQRVENMLRRLTAMMHVYSPNTRRQFEVRQVHDVHKSGRQSVIRRTHITVSAVDGIAQLKERSDRGESRVSRLLRLARSNGRTDEALTLLQLPEPGWAAVYDVLKFLNSGLAAGLRKKVKNFLRTANHYRHLGEPGHYPLPSEPPNLPQARTFAFGLLRDWLEGQIREDRSTAK